MLLGSLSAGKKLIINNFFSEYICFLIGIIADTLVRKNLITLTNVRKLFNSLTSFIPCLCMIALCFCDENHQILGIISILFLLLSSGKVF
jgi:hypothetical protein